MLLTPRDNITTGSPPRLTLSVKNDALLYKVPEGMEWLALQLDAAGTGSWTAGAVITSEVSLDGVNFYNAITYTAVGFPTLRCITGSLFMRLRVSTAQAGTDTIIPTVNVGNAKAYWI